MSTSIDNRVVEMKFDNDNFEKNVKQSQETLKKFKEALNLTSSAETFNKSMQEAVNGVNFDSMAASLEFLSDRFSNLGIIGITVLQNITNAAINAAKNIVGYVTNAIIQGGKTRAQNIENAKFQLEGLGKKWADIEEDINYGVKDTAYGLDSAAMAASQLVASGVEFGETFGETGNSPMAKALRGISGLAAMTNSSYEDMAHIFTTVAGNGRLMTEQLRSISYRGVNASAQLRDVFNGVNQGLEQYNGISDETRQKIKLLTNGLEITEEQLNEFVSKGKIDFAMFSESMDAAFGQHAKDANNTLQGVLANTRAALAKIGADFWSPILMNNGSVVEMFKSLKARIDDVKLAIRDMLGFEKDEFGNENLVQWKNLVDKVFGKLKETFDNVDVKKLTENVQTILKTIINLGKSVVNIFNAIKLLTSPIVEAFKKIFNVDGASTFLNYFLKISEVIKNFTGVLAPMIRVKGLSEDVFNIAKAIFSVASLGWDIIKGIANVIGGIVKSLIPAADSTLKLGSGLATVVTNITEFIKKSKVIENTFNTIKLVVTNATEIIVKFVSSILEGFTKVTLHTDNVKDSFSKFSDILSNIGGTINAFLKTHFPGLKDGLSDIGGVIGKVLGFVGSLFGKLKDFAGAIAPGITVAVEKIASLVGKLADAVVKVFNNLDTDKLFSIVNKGIFTAILAEISGFISNLSAKSASIGQVIDKLQFHIADAIGANGTRAAMIKQFAISIGILAGALFVLSSVDPDKLTAPLAALSAIMWEFVSVIKMLVPIIPSSTSISKSISGLFDSIASGIQLDKQSNAFVKLSAAIFIIAGALRMLAELDAEQLAVGVAGISVIMIELAMVADYLSKSEKTMIKGAAALLPFSAAVLILAKSVENLSELSWEGLAKGLLGLTTIIGTLTGMAITLEKTESSLRKFGLSLIPFAAGVLILSESVEKLSALSWEELARGLAGFASVLGIVTGMAITLEKTSSSLTKLGLAMIPFATGVVILSEAIEKFADLSWSELAVGLTGFAAAMGVVAGLAITLEKTSSSIMSIGLAMIPFATGVEILAVAIKKLSGLSWNDLLKGLTGLAAALGAVIGLAVAMQYSGSSLASTGAGLLVFAGALALLVPELKALGGMSWGNIAKAITALAAALTVLGVAGVILSPMAKDIALLGAAVAAFGAGLALAGAGILAFASGLTALGVSLGSLGSGIATLIKEIIGLIPAIIDGLGDIVSAFANFLTTAFSSIVKMFVSFIAAVCDAILEAAPKILSTIVQLLDSLIEYLPQIIDKVITMVVKIIEGVADRMHDLVGAIGKLVGAFFDAVMDLFKDVTLTELVNALKDLSAMALYLAIVGEMGAAAIKGLGILAILIAGLGAITVGLGALVNAIPELEELLTKGIPILSKIGYAIGEFVGNLIGGVLGGLSNALPQIGENLSLFMINLKPFIEGAKEIDSSVAKSAGYLAETILILTASSILSGIAKFLGGGTDFGELGKQLVPFGEAMSDFAKEVKGIDTEAVESAASAGKMIAEMAKALPNEGGLLGKIVGENSMGLIGPQLKDFGQSLSDFSGAITGVDADAVARAAHAGTMVAEMAATLPNSGGLVSFFTGENDLDDFSEKLPKFGEAITKYSNVVQDFQSKGVNASIHAGQMLAEMAATIPNTGGLVAFFAGNNDLDDFGNRLEKFGQNIVKYSNAVQDFKSNGVAASIHAGQMLVEMAATIPNTGGLVAFFAGDSGLEEFGQKLPDFGKALTDYSTNLQGLQTENLYASVDAAKALADVAATIPDTGGILSIFGGDNDFGKFGSQLAMFATSLVTYSNEVGKVNYSAVDTATKEIEKLIEMFNNLKAVDFTIASNFKMALEQIASAGIKGFTDTFSRATSEVESVSKSVKDATVDGFKNLDHDLYKKGESASKSFVNGFEKNKSTAKTSASDLADSVLKGLEKAEKNAKDSATKAINEFLKAFTDQQQTAYNKGVLVGQKAVDGLKANNFYNVGVYAMQGYINGMNDMYWRVYNAAYNVSAGAVKAARIAMQEKSPSRVMREIGAYGGEGMALGFEDSSSLVDSSASKMAKTAIQAVAKSLSTMRGIIDDDLEIQPVITPVLDASQIQNGIDTINGITNNGYLAGATGYRMVNGFNYSSPVGLSSSYNDSNVVFAINNLEKRMDSMVSRMENLQVVLDSGELVGATAPMMNDEFGDLDSLVKRGVM